MDTARFLLVSIIGGPGLSLSEIGDAVTRIQGCRLASRLASNAARLKGRSRGSSIFDSATVKQSLVTLLARPDLTGHVYLTGSEHGGATLDLNHGRGVLTIELESAYGDQDGGGTLTLTTDQSHLAEAVRALNRVLGGR